MANPIFGNGEKFFRQPQPAYAGAPGMSQARPDFQPAPGPNYQDGYSYRQAQPGFNRPPAVHQQYDAAPHYDAGQPMQDWQQAPYQQLPSGQADQATQQSVMTYESVLTKTTISLFAVFLTAAFGFFLVPYQWVTPVWIGAGVASFITVLVVAGRRVVSPVGLGVYALFEGLFLGVISKFFDALFPGIIAPAVLATFITALATLAVVRFTNFRTTPRMRKIVMIATWSFLGVMLVNLVLVFAGVNTGLRMVGADAGVIAWVVSLLAIGLAVFNLVMDFEAVEFGVQRGAPDSESWRAALGITVTMVWLYVEILRVLSYFRD